MKVKIIIAKIFLYCMIALTVSCNTNNDSDKAERDIQVRSHPKNVILMIGDGIGVSQVSAALYVSNDKLNIARCNYIGFVKTSSNNKLLTDSGASGTAMATGIKTNNGYVGVDPEGKPVRTILEIAEDNGLSTGLVATSYITHSTPASFIAHNSSRNDYESIALDFLKTDIDVFIGGGRKHFAEREDGRNLIDSLIAREYHVVFDTLEMEQSGSDKLAALLYDEHPPKYSEGRGNMLLKASLKALDILNTNDNGFFIMIEGSQIDWAGHDNDYDYLISEMIDFDNAVGAVLDFAEQDGETLVIITSDHETGGFGITGGDLMKGTLTGSFLSDEHTATLVPLFAYGPGAEEFTGIYDNTEIFHKLMKAFGFER